MPPNPARQAKLQANRDKWANDPALQETIDAAGEAVLNKYKGNPEASAVKPRQMLPSYYRKGGKVIKSWGK